MSEVEAGWVGTIHGIDIFNFTGSSKLTNIIKYSYFGNLDYSAFGGDPFANLTDPVKRVEFRYGADPGNFAQVDPEVSDGVMTIRVSGLSLFFAGSKAFSYAVIHEPNHHNALIDERRDNIIKSLGLFNADSFAGPYRAQKLGIVKNIVEELVLRDSMRGMELANPTLKNAIGSYANWPSLDEILNGYGEKLYKYPGGIVVQFSSDDLNFLKAALKSLESEGYAIDSRCFPAHTRIQTSRTTSTAISALRVGDVVLAFDARADKGRGALVPRRVTRLYRNTTTDWLRLRWFDGTAREGVTTPGHDGSDALGGFPTTPDMTRTGRMGVYFSAALARGVALGRRGMGWNAGLRQTLRPLPRLLWQGCGPLRGDAPTLAFGCSGAHARMAGSCGAVVKKRLPHRDARGTVALSGRLCA